MLRKLVDVWNMQFSFGKDLEKPVKVHTGSPSPVFVPQTVEKTVEKTGGHKDLEFSILKGLEKLAEV